MADFDHRLFLAATAAAVATPNVASELEATKIMDWQTMSLDARNAAFNNVAHVGPDIARQKTEAWAAESAKLREQRPKHLNLAYGQGERTKWDLYPASDPKAPCFVHIHGGYWQRGSREIFACLADGVLARGWSAALPGYTLAPDASLTQITRELRTAFDWLSAQSASHGIEGPVIISGWSAGGHLTAFDIGCLRTRSPARLPACERQGEIDRSRDRKPLSDTLAGRQQAARHRVWHERAAGDDRLQPRFPRLPVAVSSPRPVDTDRKN
jgi:acetyl esterase/lipase